MNEPVGVRRAREDIAAGELWRARDRLHGVIQNSHANQPALDLLGEVYFKMGDQPQAGRFWFLTDRDDEDANRARQAFERSHPLLPDRLRAVPARKPVGAYPQIVRDRLASLQAQAVKQGIDWEPRKQIKPRPGPRDREGNELTGIWAGLAVAAILLLTLGIWLVGLVAIVLLAADLIR